MSELRKAIFTIRVHDDRHCSGWCRHLNRQFQQCDAYGTRENPAKLGFNKSERRFIRCDECVNGETVVVE